MSDTSLEKSMAPKRQRMMDMILALSGLKEESGIPLSKVNEELETLKAELSPLTEAIFEFPNLYYEAFLEAANRVELVGQIADKAVLTEAAKNLETALSSFEFNGIAKLLESLQDTTSQDETGAEPTEDTHSLDLENILGQLSGIISQIESTIDEFEAKAKTDAEAAQSELDSLTESLQEIISDLRSNPEETLDALQKLGTKTRYGPFLRSVAQIKRGKREGRIDDSRFLALLFENVPLELNRGLVLFILNKMGSKTVVQMAELLKTNPSGLQKAIVTMIQRGEIEMVGLDNDAPIFSRVLGKAPDTTLILKRVIQQIRAMINSLEGDTKDLAEDSLEKLDPLYERFLILGEYDETSLSTSMNKLRTSIDTATEAVLSSQTTDSSEGLRLLISAGLEAFARFRLKITLEKGPNLVSGVNVYGEKLDPEFYQKMMDTYLDNEIERGTMLILIRELGAQTAHDLAQRTGIPQDRVFSHLLRMKRDELLTLAGETHGYVLYDVPRTPSEAEVTLQTVSELALQLATARANLEKALGDIKAEDIGIIANALEAFSKSRDKLVKVTVGGSVVNQAQLEGVEDTIRSAVVMTARTRARLPSTRPKVTIDDLTAVDVPSVMEEYRPMVGYAPLLGFGTINWNAAKCLGCKSCEIACPEDAIELKPVIDTTSMFEFSDSEMETLPVNKSLFYQAVRTLAVDKPTKNIELEKDAPGFGTVETDLYLCIGCRTCVRRCPGPETGALELELKWTLPEVIKQITSRS